MSAQLSDLSSRARWIVHTQVAALSRRRKHTFGIHTRATGESQVREAMTAVLAETGPEPPA